MNGMLKRRERSDSHIAEWLIYGVYERDTGSNPERRIFFFVLLRSKCIERCKIFFLLTIDGTPTRSQRRRGFSTMLIPNMQFVFFRELFLQNRSTVICEIFQICATSNDWKEKAIVCALLLLLFFVLYSYVIYILLSENCLMWWMTSIFIPIHLRH